MDPGPEIDRILKDRGAVLERNRKHDVFRFPGGQIFIRARTPSDHRGRVNELARLRRTLGLHDEDRGQPGERREKVRPAAAAPESVRITPAGGGAKTLREQLEETRLREVLPRGEEMQYGRDWRCPCVWCEEGRRR